MRKIRRINIELGAVINVTCTNLNPVSASAKLKTINAKGVTLRIVGRNSQISGNLVPFTLTRKSISALTSNILTESPNPLILLDISHYHINQITLMAGNMRSIFGL